MKIEYAFFNNETKEMTQRDVKMLCVDKERHIFRPEEPYSLVVMFGGMMVVTQGDDLPEENVPQEDDSQTTS